LDGITIHFGPIYDTFFAFMIQSPGPGTLC